MAKWFIKALSAGASPLQTLLRHQLLKLRAQERGTWLASQHWALISKFKAPKGSRAWNCIVQSWRKFSPLVESLPPLNRDEVFSSTLWWTTVFFVGAYGVSHLQATTLMKSGLIHIRDLWKAEENKFHIGTSSWQFFHPCQMSPGLTTVC
jgi:hypothetical protein